MAIQSRRNAMDATDEGTLAATHHAEFQAHVVIHSMEGFTVALTSATVAMSMLTGQVRNHRQVPDIDRLGQKPVKL
jgi:hypothetical protein